MSTPGWYDDPDDRTLLRWWDGSSWSQHTMPLPSGVPEMGNEEDDEARLIRELEEEFGELEEVGQFEDVGEPGSSGYSFTPTPSAESGALPQRPPGGQRIGGGPAQVPSEATDGRDVPPTLPGDFSQGQPFRRTADEPLDGQRDPRPDPRPDPRLIPPFDGRPSGPPAGGPSEPTDLREMTGRPIGEGGERPRPPWVREEEVGGVRGNERPVPPWMREDDSGGRGTPSQPPKGPAAGGSFGAGGPPAGRPEAEGERSTRRPPWEDDDERGRPPRPGREAPPWENETGDRRETRSSRGTRPRPPWEREDEGDEDDDDEYYSRPQRRPSGEPPRPASWEEMSQSGFEDEGEDGSVGQEKVKRYLFIGAGVAVGLLVAYMAFSFIRGGEPSGSASTEATGVELTKIDDWAKWPNARGGYVVQFPKTPTYIRESEYATWRVSISEVKAEERAAKGEPAISEQDAPERKPDRFFLFERYIDPNLLPEERLVLLQSFLSQRFPSQQLGEFVPSSLGGFPARKALLESSDVALLAIGTVSGDTLYVLVAEIEKPQQDENSQTEVMPTGDAKRFFDSFKWFRQP